MQWFGWAVAVGTEVVLIVLALRLLAGWPPHVGVVCAAATLPIPVALIVGSSNRLIGRIDRLLAQTVSIAGLSSLASIAGLPTTVFLSPGGKVLYVHTGQYETLGTLDQDIQNYALK